MAEADISRQVRRFIAKYIDSVGQLEALLLLRATPELAWDVPLVARRLYASEAETTQILDQLCRNGLLVCTDKVYRYQCRTE